MPYCKQKNFAPCMCCSQIAPVCYNVILRSPRKSRAQLRMPVHGAATRDVLQSRAAVRAADDGFLKGRKGRITWLLRGSGPIMNAAQPGIHQPTQMTLINSDGTDKHKRWFWVTVHVQAGGPAGGPAGGSALRQREQEHFAEQRSPTRPDLGVAVINMSPVSPSWELKRYGDSAIERRVFHNQET